jgi:hypothetical protein
MQCFSLHIFPDELFILLHKLPTALHALANITGLLRRPNELREMTFTFLKTCLFTGEVQFIRLSH